MRTYYKVTVRTVAVNHVEKVRFIVEKHLRTEIYSVSVIWVRKKAGVNANVSVAHLSFQLEAKGSRLKALLAPISITQPNCHLLNCTGARCTLRLLQRGICGVKQIIFFYVLLRLIIESLSVVLTAEVIRAQC